MQVNYKVVEVDLPCFRLAAIVEIPICAVQGVEGIACEIHGQEVQVETLDAIIAAICTS